MKIQKRSPLRRTATTTYTLLGPQDTKLAVNLYIVLYEYKNKGLLTEVVQIISINEIITDIITVLGLLNSFDKHRPVWFCCENKGFSASTV